MKSNSQYKVWQQFVNQTVLFFDGENRKEFISELCQLQHSLSLLDMGEPSTQALEKILSDFENKSGFSSALSILPSDGDKGLLSPEQFKNILSLGHPINDFGTSLHHGALSHRLQFYILGHYFLKNVAKFFTPEYLEELTNALAVQYPDMLDEEGTFPIDKIISVFYRLLGSEEFNNCFDWDAFLENRDKLNLKFNKKNIPEQLNTADIWVQLFDRYGYAGFFSVPSTVGILQKLGCFSSLPTISIPNIDPKNDLKVIIDVTSTFNAY